VPRGVQGRRRPEVRCSVDELQRFPLGSRLRWRIPSRVKVTDWPRPDGFGEAVSVVAVAVLAGVPS